MYLRYRNSDARHHHETETKRSLFNLRKEDRLIKRKTGLTNAIMDVANNTSVNGKNVSEVLADTLKKFK